MLYLKMNITRRGFTKCFAALLLITLTLLLVVAHQINEAIFSPPRRALQDYHMQRLTDPKAFGIHITSHDCLNGKVPCLLIEPDGVAGPGKRGKILRQQLIAKDVSLPAYGRVTGVVVLLHGRKGRKEDLLPTAERFVAAGFRCILPDLPGHGDSPLDRLSFGSSEFERQLPHRILQEMKATFGLPEEPAALWGLSMGGAVAVNAAGNSPNDWDAMIVVSSFADLTQVMAHNMPPKWRSLFPAMMTFLNLERSFRGLPSIRAMSPQQTAKAVNVPSLLVHGDQDHYVTIKQGKQLYSALQKTEKQWITVPHGGHRNVLATPMPVYAAMTEWLLRITQREGGRH